ncbi:uncharacterized protein LOC142225974 [Haematobia irritans]|uniref:uncharacterized protein LOC142225974 n=1 Tax=Haematobia irritans TaxID=7368 RepID=UPI003F4FD11E
MDESHWPLETQMKNCSDDSGSELRSKHIILFTNQVRPEIPEFNRFSKYSRLRRTMAWVRRYILNLLYKLKGIDCIKGELTVEEEVWAENHLCQEVQKSCFANEITCIQKNKSVANTSSIKSLNPFIGVDGLLRGNGRLVNAPNLSIEAKNPIILPTKHLFTRLLVESYHTKFQHINTSTVMNEIRQRFWVPSLRRLLNSVQSSCRVCRLHRAKPSQPQVAPLPIDRVTPYVRPFTYTGVDYFGPLNVTVRRQREKRWVCLFTCLTVRAVHLELSTDLSTDAFLLCLRNFVNRRGLPLVIRSDNGTNFVGVAKELQGVNNFFDNNVITSSLAGLGIKWIFNSPANPSEGGVWERLVRSVKKALFMMLKEQAPREATLHSFLIESENMVNSRPLTHLPVTPSDPDPLTPNHFLLGCLNSTQTPAPFEPRLMCLRKQWRVLQNLKNGMWRQWMSEYLPEMTRRSKWCLPSNPISVGCLIFICDPDMPRSQWKRGRVTELFVGKDGVARSALVSTVSGQYRRPISKLAVLDVHDSCEASPSGSVHGGEDVVDGNPKNGSTTVGNASGFEGVRTATTEQ